jgi:hypothetical protein
MKVLAAYIVLLMFGSGQVQTTTPAVGLVLAEPYVAQHHKATSGELVFDETKAHPAYSHPYLSDVINGVEYLIAYSKETREITYVHTSDPNFKTEDGLKLGDCISWAESESPANAAWELRAPLTSDGWYPVLSIESYSHRVRLGANECMVVTGFSKGGL